MSTAAMPKQFELTERQIRFAHEYIVDANGTQAAIRAGYTKSSASKAACRLLKLPEIQTALADFRDALVASTDIRAERTVEELQAIAYANVADYLVSTDDGPPRWKDPSELSAKQLVAVRRIDNRDGEIRHIELYNKLEALEKLCRMSGSFPKDEPEHDDPTEDSELAAMMTPIDSSPITENAPHSA